MKDNIIEFPPEYEEMINKLEKQITDLFSELNYYQALVTEKENTIIRLTAENRYLKAQLQDLPQKITPPPSPPQELKTPSPPSQESYTPPPISKYLDAPSYPSKKLYVPPPPPPKNLHAPSSPNQELLSPLPSPPQQKETTTTSEEVARINKRVCPECGAMGFAIQEVDDKTRVLSYSPQRIYKKKKVCTKCQTEFL